MSLANVSTGNLGLGDVREYEVRTGKLRTGKQWYSQVHQARQAHQGVQWNPEGPVEVKGEHTSKVWSAINNQFLH